MKAMILSAGTGERLGELTKNTQKTMLPVKGKPVLEHQIEFLKRQNITDIVLGVGYLKEQVIDYFGDGSKFGVNIEYSIADGTNLGTAGIVKNYPFDDTFVVINGDTLLDIDLNELLKAHKKQNKLITLTISETPNPKGCGVFSFDNGFTEKPDLTDVTDAYVSCGCYVFEPLVLDYIGESIYCSLEENIFPMIDLGYYIYKGDWIDMGTNESYEQVR